MALRQASRRRWLGRRREPGTGETGCSCSILLLTSRLRRWIEDFFLRLPDDDDDDELDDELLSLLSSAKVFHGCPEATRSMDSTICFKSQRVILVAGVLVLAAIAWWFSWRCCWYMAMDNCRPPTLRPELLESVLLVEIKAKTVDVVVVVVVDVTMGLFIGRLFIWTKLLFFFFFLREERKLDMMRNWFLDAGPSCCCFFLRGGDALIRLRNSDAVRFFFFFFLRASATTSLLRDGVLLVAILPIVRCYKWKKKLLLSSVVKVGEGIRCWHPPADLFFQSPSDDAAWHAEVTTQSRGSLWRRKRFLDRKKNKQKGQEIKRRRQKLSTNKLVRKQLIKNYAVRKSDIRVVKQSIIPSGWSECSSR